MEIRKADWKHEKHVPVVEVLSREGNEVEVRVQVGKEIPHPNTQEHHIKFIELYFQPEGAAYDFLIGRASFEAHGEAGTFTEPVAYFRFRTDKKGRLKALSLCNLHGLWEGEAEL